MRAGRRGGACGAAAAQAVRWEGPTVEVAGRARAERTWNMCCMKVTLEMSKYSGWLNAYAHCRVEKGSIGRKGGGMRAGQRAGVGRQWRKQRAGRVQPRWWLAGYARGAPGTCSPCLRRETCRGSAAG